MLINRAMDKKMWYIYTMQYYSAIKQNKILPLAETQLDLQTVIYSELRQKEKKKYHILTRICGMWKNGTDEPICKAEVETQM